MARPGPFQLLANRVLGAVWIAFGLVVAVPAIQDAVRQTGDSSQRAAGLLVASFGVLSLVAGLVRMLALRAGSALLTCVALLLIAYCISLLHLEGTAARMEAFQGMVFAALTIAANWALRRRDRTARTAQTAPE